MNDLNDQVERWSRRARWQRSFALLFLGLAAGLGVALIVALASRLTPLLNRPALVILSIILALFGLLTALLYPWLRSLGKTSVAWAREFDAQFDLKERVSTTLELNAGKIVTKNNVIRKDQKRDAEQIAAKVNIKKNLPFRLSRRDALVGLLFLVALVVTLLFPNPQEQALANQARLREVARQQIQQLEQAKQAISQSSLSDEQKKAAIQALENAQRQLSDSNLTPEKALAAINDAQTKLDALRDQMNTQRQDDLQDAGQSLAPDELTNALANALANREFDRAAEHMRQLTRPNGERSLNEDEMQRLADQLEQLARDVRNSDPQLAQRLRDAAQQMREGREQEARQSLEQAARQVQQTGQQQQNQQALDAAQQRAEMSRRALQQAASGDPSARSQQQGGVNTDGIEGQELPNSNQQNQQQGGREAFSQDGAQVPGNLQGSSAGGEGAQEARERTGHSEDFGSQDSVYAPNRVAGGQKQVVLPDREGINAPDPNGRRSVAPEGGSVVPYQDVYGDYAGAADEALQGGAVPSDKRDYVKDYFSSLDPKREP